jgi:hypothetical protein
VGVPELATPYSLAGTLLGERFNCRGSTAGSICGMQPVEVKGKMHKKLDIFGSIVKLADETPQ